MNTPDRADTPIGAVVRSKALTFGAAGWIDDLPEFVAELERDWQITVGRPYADATEAFVAEAALADGTPAVLKLTIPRAGGHAAREITVLRLAGGDGCARLLRSDAARGALLLERLGRPLERLGLPVRRRHEILCATASRIWRPAPDCGLPTGAEHGRWLAGYISATWADVGHPCSQRAVDYALACAERRIAAHDDERAVLVHGDVHQWNVLEAPGGFKLVDPDGLLAEAEYDLGIVMREDPVELMAGDPRDRARWLARRVEFREHESGKRRLRRYYPPPCVCRPHHGSFRACRPHHGSFRLMTAPATSRLLALSDLHVAYAENRKIIEDLRPESEADWLLVAGDVGERSADIEWALRTLSERFATVVWTPGNHDLWTHRSDPLQLRGEERYLYLVDMCRRLGVITPEDPYPVWQGPEGAVTVAPVFLLYDYSFRPDGALTKEEGLAVAYKTGIVCSDEALLHPDPYPSREDWCWARLEATERRLADRDPALPVVFVTHYPLVRDPTRVLRYPQFAQWCGTTRTHDWHVRFNAAAVVYGHLHIPRVTWHDGVRFEEVSIGYPREWQRRNVSPGIPRQILPAVSASTGEA